MPCRAQTEVQTTQRRGRAWAADRSGNDEAPIGGGADRGAPIDADLRTCLYRGPLLGFCLVGRLGFEGIQVQSPAILFERLEVQFPALTFERV